MRQLLAAILMASVCVFVLVAASASARSGWQVPWRIVGSGGYLAGPGGHLPLSGQPPLPPGVFIEPRWEVFVISSAAYLRTVVSDVNSRIGATLSIPTNTDFRSRRLLVIEKNYSVSSYGLVIDGITSVGSWARVRVHDTYPTCTQTMCVSAPAFFWVVKVISVPRRLFPVPVHLALSVAP